MTSAPGCDIRCLVPARMLSPEPYGEVPRTGPPEGGGVVWERWGPFMSCHSVPVSVVDVAVRRVSYLTLGPREDPFTSRAKLAAGRHHVGVLRNLFLQHNYSRWPQVRLTSSIKMSLCRHCQGCMVEYAACNAHDPNVFSIVHILCFQPSFQPCFQQAADPGPILISPGIYY